MNRFVYGVSISIKRECGELVSLVVVEVMPCVDMVVMEIVGIDPDKLSVNRTCGVRAVLDEVTPTSADAGNAANRSTVIKEKPLALCLFLCIFMKFIIQLINF